MKSTKSASKSLPQAAAAGKALTTSPTKAYPRAGTHPNTRDDSRRALFEQAGLSLERQADLLKRCVEVDEAGLSAMKETVVSNKFGTEIVKTVDVPTRLRASDQLKATLGAYPSRAGDSSGPGDTIVNVVLPDWAVSKPKTQVKVIDVPAELPEV